ncbi:MAG: adenylate/guanylate cyclase domain-containing protein, partial [Candidatus Nanopelagicales bacterium]
MHLGSMRPGTRSRTAVKGILHSELAAFSPGRCLDPDVFSGATVSTADTTVLFVDLAGFTNLTETLATFGTRGTEQLSEVVGDFFSRVTEQVLKHDGDPLSYGGDALTITFDGPAPDAMERAKATATSIHRLTADVSDFGTVGGRISLAARIGIARGPVSTAVATSTTRVSPFHVGSTLDDAVAAESRAENGHTVVADSTDQVPAETSHASGSERTDEDSATLELEKLVHPLVLEHVVRGAKLPSSHRMVTVSFIGFPPVQPGDVPRFQRRVSSLLALVANNGGELVQVSGGDKGIVAFVVFGAPVAHDDDPMRAVQTMLELRRLDPSIRVGITSGPVFATYLGTPQRRFPAHFGRAVNTAARLMQHADVREILVSPDTWRSTGAFLRQRGATRELALKGVDEPLVVRAIAGWRAQRRPKSQEPVMPIIGRDIELISVERFLGGIATGGGGSVTISGEPGIGKSRLAEETVDRARTRGMNVFSVDADDYPQAQQYRMWRHLLLEALGLPENSGRDLLMRTLRELLPEHVDPLDQVAPLIGLRSSARVTSSDEHEPLEQEMALAHRAISFGCQSRWIHLTRALWSGFRDNPTLLEFENTHRLNSLSVKLIQELAASMQDRQVGLLSVGRPATVEHGGAADYIVRRDAQLVLEELDLAAAGALADSYWRELGGGTPPGWLHEAVTTQAGGNPLLIRTATRLLMGSWSPGSPAP